MKKSVLFHRTVAMVLASVLYLGLIAPSATAAEQTARRTVAGSGQDLQGGANGQASLQSASNRESAEALTAEESADLSQRDEEPGREVVGGALSNLHLTYIVIALATAVIVLIATK
jgi:hypothetical protein